jgi:hypothetical protein
MELNTIARIHERMKMTKTIRQANCSCKGGSCYLCGSCKKLKRNLYKGYHECTNGSRRERARQEINERIVYEYVFDLVDEIVLIQEMLQEAPIRGVRDSGHTIRMAQLYKTAYRRK